MVIKGKIFKVVRRNNFVNLSDEEKLNIGLYTVDEEFYSDDCELERIVKNFNYVKEEDIKAFMTENELEAYYVRSMNNFDIEKICSDKLRNYSDGRN